MHLVQVEERLGTQRLLQGGTVVEGAHQGGIHTATELIVHVQTQVAAAREVKPTRTRQEPKVRVSAAASSGVLGASLIIYSFIRCQQV